MTRLLIAALLFVSSAVSAQEVQAAGFENNMGGWTIIVNRDHYCGSRGMRDGYAYGTNGAMYTRFCWIQRHDAILAVLEDGETRAWPVAAFETLPTEPEVNNNKS